MAIRFQILKLHEVFQRELQYGECRYLQYKIEQYASELLCKYWPFLGITPLKIPEGFLEKIIEEIYPPSVRGSQYESSFLDLMAEGVGLFIYRISLHIALYAKGLVMAAFEKQPNSMVMLSEASYSVFPVAYNNGWANRFSVIVSFSRQLIETRYVLISVSKPKVYEYLKIDNNNLNELKSLMVDFGYMSL